MSDAQRRPPVARLRVDRWPTSERFRLPSAERIHDLMPTIAPRLARAVVIAVLSGFVATAGINMILGGGALHDLAFAVLYGAALVTVHLRVIVRPRHDLSRAVRYATLAAEACLVYLPLLHLGAAWIGLPGFLVGGLLVLLRPVAAIPLAVAVVASMTWYSYSIYDAASALYTSVATTLTGLIIYGMTRLYQLVDQVHAAQDTFAQLAVAAERARFSRDVHDLLGLSLSAIMLKTELIAKVLDDEPERARQELDEVMQVTRKALAEARQVANGYRGLTLAEECRSAVSVLTTANVEVTVERDDTGFPEAVSSTLATVLRECVTNVLRHSEASWCTITLGTRDGAAELEVVNDGVLAPRAARTTAGGGSGLPNLTERVRSHGGELVSGIEGGERHRLRVTIPIDGKRALPGGSTRAGASGF